MKKYLKILPVLLLCNSLFSQIGVNTGNPQQLFHLDGKSSIATTNPPVGIPTLAQQTDDIVVTKDGRLGVGTINPTQSLDVNGRAKIRVTDGLLTNESYQILVRNTAGDIKQIPSTTFATSFEKQTISLSGGASTTITSANDFQSANIIILSKNGCARNMIASFQAFNGALVYLNGIARDIIGSGSVVTIPSGAITYSPTWIIKFPNVYQCGNDMGTQFDFTLYKEANNRYVLKNDGQANRTYDVIFQRID